MHPEEQDHGYESDSSMVSLFGHMDTSPDSQPETLDGYGTDTSMGSLFGHEEDTDPDEDEEYNPDIYYEDDLEEEHYDPDSSEDNNDALSSKVVAGESETSESAPKKCTSRHSWIKNPGTRGPRLPNFVIAPRPTNRTSSSGFLFGRGFVCSGGDHLLPGTLCGVLATFDLIYAPSIECIVCPTHGGGCIIPANLLRKHIVDHHLYTMAQRCGASKIILPDKEWLRIITHITTSYGINPQQSYQDLVKVLPSTLSTPIPVSGGDPNKSHVGFFYECPQPECIHYAMVPARDPSKTANISRHVKTFHPELSMRNISYKLPKFMQKMQIYPGASLKSIFFNLAAVQEDSTSERADNPVYSAPTFEGFEFATAEDRMYEGPWLDRLGWPSYMSFLGEETSIHTLKALAVLPSNAHVNALKEHGQKQWIERGLYALRRESILYFQDAIEFLNASTMQLRKEVIKNTKRTFAPIVASTVKKYIRPIISCIAMMVRFLNAKQSNDVQMLHSLGKFTLEASSNQLRCATDLQSCFIASKGKPDTVQLQQLMHATFDALLRPSNHLSGQFIACPTNQALLLLSLVGEGQYTTAQTLKSECAALQWTFQAILVHIARLRYLHQEQYVPSDPTGAALLGSPSDGGKACHASTDNGKQDHVSSISPCDITLSANKATMNIQHGMDEGYSEGYNDGYDNGYDDYGTVPNDIEGGQILQDVFSILDFDPSNVQEEREQLHSATKQITEYIYEEKTLWLNSDPLAKHTPWKQMKDIFFAIAPQARAMRGASSIAVSRNGQTYTISDSFSKPLKVPMDMWQELCREFCDSLPTLTSKMIHISKCTQEYRKFDASVMSDDLSDVGIHLQQKNVVETTYIRNAMVKNLTTCSESTLNEWFSYETEILERIAVIFHLTAGPSFRSFQIGNLKYDTCSSFGRRNLFLIANPTRRQFTLVKPKAKLKDAQAKTLLAFPECITDPLAFYFCVLRPVGTELSSSGSVTVPQELTKGINLYSAFIWGPRRQRTWKSKPPRPWKGPEIDAALMKHTLPAFKCRMTGGIVRQVVHAVFREKFPSLFKGSQNTSSSIISSLQSGELRTYMSSLPFPAFDDMNQAQCTSHFIVSEIWQAALGLTTLSSPLRELVPQSHLFPTTEFYTIAINKARYSVELMERSLYVQKFRKYLIRSRQEDNPMDGSDVNSNTFSPVIAHWNAFLQIKDAAELLDNALMLDVTHAVLFGTSKPRLHSTPPLAGLHAHDIALAVFLLEHVLNGTESTLIDLQASQNSNMYRNMRIVDHQQRMCEVKRIWPAQWVRFSEQVYAYGEETPQQTGDATKIFLDLIFNKPALT